MAAVLSQVADHGCRLLLAPWIADPHCDHEAAALVARAAALRAGLRSLFYPVWGWCLPPDTPVPDLATCTTGAASVGWVEPPGRGSGRIGT